MAKILIVDDSSLVRNYFKGRLELEGHSCAVASDGNEVLQIILGNSFDLIITDIIMRHLGGIETIRAVRSVDKKIPIIAITGSREAAQEMDVQLPTDSLKLAMSAGATTTIRKPFSYQQLAEVVHTCLGTTNDKRAAIGL